MQLRFIDIDVDIVQISTQVGNSWNQSIQLFSPDFYWKIFLTILELQRTVRVEERVE